MTQDPYRWIAPWYDRLLGPMNRDLRLLGLRMFRPKSGMAVLDVGCGTGVHLELYQPCGCELYGIDPSPAMVAVAAKRLGDRAHLHLGDAAQMPYADGTFDLVFAMFSLHEMDPATRSRALGEMVRVVKECGRLLLIDFHPGPIQGLQGRFNRLKIVVAELAAGRRHFNNSRHLLATGGLAPLIEAQGLQVVKRRIVGGGTLALYTLRKG